MEAMPDTKAKNLWLERYQAQSGKSTTTILLNAIAMKMTLNESCL